LATYPEYAEEIAEHVVIPQNSASMDYMIGSAQHVHRGLGRHMLSCFIDKVFSEAIEHLVVPTHLDNKASWRVLEKLGFQRIAICEMEPDNPQYSTAHAIYLKSRV
jgi:aminoglycoside 6'-N-acetyltransferase